MIEKVIEALNNGLDPNYTIAEFGDGTNPSPPYVVVKEENDIGNRGTAYRVIAHFTKGQQNYLRNAIKRDIPNILNDFIAVDDNGFRNQLEIADENTLPETIIVNDDNTISMEILYFKADRYFG